MCTYFTPSVSNTDNLFLPNNFSLGAWNDLISTYSIPFAPYMDSGNFSHLLIIQFPKLNWTY